MHLFGILILNPGQLNAYLHLPKVLAHSAMVLLAAHLHCHVEDDGDDIEELWFYMCFGNKYMYSILVYVV